MSQTTTTTSTIAHNFRHKRCSSHNQANNRLIELQAARAIEVLNFALLGMAMPLVIMYSSSRGSYIGGGLVRLFSEYGHVTSALVMRDADGNSKGFGFVNFKNAEDAAKVVDALNG
ncbi:polyadenylate-binding protein 2-like protein [Tanacetum coccineum]